MLALLTSPRLASGIQKYIFVSPVDGLQFHTNAVSNRTISITNDNHHLNHSTIDIQPNSLMMAPYGNGPFVGPEHWTVNALAYQQMMNICLIWASTVFFLFFWGEGAGLFEHVSTSPFASQSIERLT